VSPALDHPNIQAVLAALRAGGAAASGARMRVLPDAVTTARAAADAFGVDVAQIANSLVFDAAGEPLLVLASGAHRVDTGKLAAQLGVLSIKRADPAFVRAATGQPIGGVAPVGHPTRLRTVVDTALGRYDEVWAAGGVPHAVFPTTFPELVALTGGEPADVAAVDHR
jgi:prolyl-tRNA editing enzyme YbaK/EbsC (Cys-tRNA(Pro) deacylase)